MVRLDKAIANKGIASRKDLKKIIRGGRVLVNGEVVIKEDFKVNENDLVTIDDFSFVYSEFVYIMLNKPDGVISATEDILNPTVLDLIDDTTKGLFPVGRLDKDTEGLCLITNDGKLAHNLLSNKKHIKKVYEVYTKNRLSKNDFKVIEEGMLIDNNELCLPASIVEAGDHYELSIEEGKYHQIKRMMLALNNEVTYLKRIKMGLLELDPNLSLGEYRYLNQNEINMLK